MHANGVNMRYLGSRIQTWAAVNLNPVDRPARFIDQAQVDRALNVHLTSGVLCSKNKHANALILTEMISRVIKVQIREAMREAVSSEYHCNHFAHALWIEQGSKETPEQAGVRVGTHFLNVSLLPLAPRLIVRHSADSVRVLGASGPFLEDGDQGTAAAQVWVVWTNLGQTRGGSSQALASQYHL